MHYTEVSQNMVNHTHLLTNLSPLGHEKEFNIKSRSYDSLQNGYQKVLSI